MALLKHILGINARSADYLRLNYKFGRRKADDKIRTKRLLEKNEIPHPKLLKRIKSRDELDKFDWLKLMDGFVIKPAQGLGGQGVLVVKKKKLDKDKWSIPGGRLVGVEDF